MRKALLFLLLLGAGLFLLYWLDRRNQGPGGEAPQPPPQPVAGGETQGIQLGGRSQLTQFDEEGRPVLVVSSADTKSEAGADLLTGVTLELLEPATGKLQVRAHAARARPKRLESAGLVQPRWEHRLALEGVRAEILEGLPMAPIDFQSAHAVIDVTDKTQRKVLTDDPFTARAPELLITGRGLSAELDRARLEILHGGRVELTRADQPPATFAARGEGRLLVERQGGPGGPVRLEVWEGGLLVLGGADPGRLEADHVTLHARTGASGALEIERLEAEGNVDWTAGESRFRGQRLGARFGPEGRLVHARLEGAPRAELVLKLTPGVLPDLEAESQRRVVVNGRDSLDITWVEDGFKLLIEGLPADGLPNVETRDLSLWSAAGIDGWISADQRSARFEAGGGVEIKSGKAKLETAQFVVAITPDRSGEPVLVGTASGGARLEGQLPAAPGAAPRVFTLTSPDGLKIERSSRGWRVIEGTRVDVALDGVSGFQAHAERVTDFIVPQSGSGELAPEGLRFRASGASVDFDGGRVGGEELELFSVEPVPHFVLRGTPAAKAFYVGEDGEASALEVERTGDTWHARGEVTGSFELASKDASKPARLVFSGDQLTLDHVESELMPLERLRTLRLLVEGKVQGSLSGKEQTLVLRSARLSAENRMRLLPGGVEQELGSLFIAEGAVHADFVDGKSDLTVDCERFEVERTQSDLEAGFRQLTASGNVRFQGRFSGREEPDVGGECEILVFDSDRHGSLEARPHGRVTLIGRDPERKAPYRLVAERVNFELSEQDEVRLFAQEPEVRMLGLRARAERFTADDRTGVVLSGGVRLSGVSGGHVPFTLDAAEVVLVGRRTPQDESVDVEDQLDALHARGGVDFRLGDSLRARGERLAVRRSTGLLRLDGAPASFETDSMRLETEWVEFDPVLQVLVGTGRGRAFALREDTQSGAGEWVVDFLSVSTLLELDSVVLVIQEPSFRAAQFQTSLRASWAILWLNRDVFQDTDKRGEVLGKVLESMGGVKESPSLNQLMGLFRSAGMAGLLREIYLEGPVEAVSEGELLARADAMYLDAASQHGWLARATVNLGGQFIGQRQEKLVIKADWLRLSGNGELRADRATATACSFDDPHVSVVTGNLRIDPLAGQGDAQYHIRLEDNRIELYDWLKVPLPTIDFSTDEELQPLLPTLSLANSARFGTLFSFAFTRPADNVGQLFDAVARGSDHSDEKQEETAEGEPAETPTDAPPPKPRSKVRAHYKVDGSYLGSRGGLLDLGLEIEAKEDYWFDLYLGLVLDTGEDRGFIQVDEDDRSTLRSWLRSRAYFDHGKSSWGFSLTKQSDEAVQSEFFEGRFLRYERAEDYVQWRRSDGEYFAQGTAKIRLDDFRNDIEELPSLSGYRGRSPLLRMGNLALIHTGDVRADYLRRRQGTGPESPFGLPDSFRDDVGPDETLDGLGEREVVRADTSQGLELPVPIGGGWKLTPFVSGRATAWSEGVDEDDAPTRLLAEAGARIAATFWKRGRSGKLHQIAPFVEYRTELTREDEDGVPVEYDAVEEVVTGDIARAGARGRFGADGENSVLDLDLIGSYASARSDGEPDGWLPLEVFARLVLEPYGHEFEIFHDARYDLENQRTKYSLISFGTHLGEEWGVQLSHQRGLDSEEQPLFEVASVSGLYRWTEKWEFEARESFSLLEDQELDTKVVVRRYGHDIVFEIESSVREGEGSSFGVSVRPRFGYDPPRVGYVPW